MTLRLLEYLYFNPHFLISRGPEYGLECNQWSGSTGTPLSATNRTTAKSDKKYIPREVKEREVKLRLSLVF